jgi:hypothetical protein
MKKILKGVLRLKKLRKTKRVIRGSVERYLVTFGVASI